MQLCPIVLSLGFMYNTINYYSLWLFDYTFDEIILKDNKIKKSFCLYFIFPEKIKLTILSCLFIEGIEEYRKYLMIVSF